MGDGRLIKEASHGSIPVCTSGSVGIIANLAEANSTFLKFSIQDAEDRFWLTELFKLKLLSVYSFIRNPEPEHHF